MAREEITNGRREAIVKRALLLAVALVLIVSPKAMAEGWTVAAWLGLSDDMRAVYVAGLWDGVKDQMSLRDTAHYRPCIDKPGRTVMTLATDLTTEAIMEPYTPEYMSDLLQCSSAQSLRVAAGRRHVSGPAGMVKHCVTVSTCERNDPMNPTTVQLDQKEEETLSFEVSDEVLESAAATEMATPYTFAPCTGLLVCPGWPGP